MPRSPATEKRVYHEDNVAFHHPDGKEKAEQAKKVLEHGDNVKLEHHIKKSTVESNRLGNNLHMS